MLRVALRLVDRHGLKALSMRRLGAALGVEGMALYRHFENKDAILDGIAELLTEEIEIPEVNAEPWTEAMRRVTRSYRARANAHPNAFPLLALRPLATPRALERAREVVDLMVAAGFDERASVLAFRTLASYAGGFALEEVAEQPAVRTPAQREEEFEFGLDTVIVGLEHNLAAPTRDVP